MEFALLSILAAFGVAFGILYRAVTFITGRRKRSIYDTVVYDEQVAQDFSAPFADLLWMGKPSLLKTHHYHYLLGLCPVFC